MSANKSSITTPNASAKPSSQPSAVLRVSTSALILSVTVDASVWPGPITGGRASGCSFRHPRSSFGFGLSRLLAVRGRVFSSSSSA
ncbi:MAG: hypothetical protein U1E76_04830 [Planctomycetota bacterium]